MAMKSTQPLTEMNTRKPPWGKGRPARKADNLTAICEPIVYKMRNPQRLTTAWASTACLQDRFTFCTFAYVFTFLKRTQRVHYEISHCNNAEAVTFREHISINEYIIISADM
jgi:hypothetical protein